jgi:SAM-dependent methyltransferase
MKLSTESGLERSLMRVERLPLPPKEYMKLVGSETPANFEETGSMLVTMLNDEGMTAAGTDFLDVGCGCGRVARFLLPTRIRSYTGFDRHPGMIRWCRDEISTRDSRFTFQHFALKSVYSDFAWDNYSGSIPAASFRFPYSDAHFDAILLASVFTHMPMEEIAHYLRQLKRVLRPGGKVLLSVFFSQSQAYVETINFFYEPEHFVRLVQQSGFSLRHRESALKVGVSHNWYVLTHGHTRVKNFLQLHKSGTSGFIVSGSTHPRPSLRLTPGKSLIFSPVNRFEGIRELANVNMSRTADGLKIHALNNDPQIILPTLEGVTPGSKLTVHAQLVVPGPTEFQIFYSTSAASEFDEAYSVRKPIQKGDNDVAVEFTEPDFKGRIRLDPGVLAGDYILKLLEVRSSSAP